ncbi:MAG TPA: ParB/RepB/Spo0J family partition protein [Terriglobia bacterium]|nr:ParB/RepB/Spo0J family partition protein [Terriglobia bacterium]
MTRKALGRGLNALIRETEAQAAPSAQDGQRGLERIPLTLIDPNPFQPRTELSESSLEELANSIRSSGILQPILLRPAGDRYQLVAGERRWRAAGRAGLDSVPALIRDIEDGEALELALAENLLREQLNPIEVAHAYDQLQKKFQLTHEQIAERLGVNRSTVTNTLRLLGLAPEVQRLVAEDKISAGHARALAAITPQEAQKKLAKLVVEKGFSVRKLESLIASRTALQEADVPKPAPKVDPNIRAAVLELERALGTRVRVVGGERRGKIEISYFSREDLNRIYEQIIH